MMRADFRILSVVSILAGWLIAGCAGLQDYNRLKNLAEELESRQQYEEAYVTYRQAAEKNPYDRKMPAKLKALEILISDEYTQNGIQAFYDKKYKTALEKFLAVALKWNPDNLRAAEYKDKAMAEYEVVLQKYSFSRELADKDRWLEAVEALNEISALYNDDPDLGAKIENHREKGSAYFRTAGLAAWHRGLYEQSLRYFESSNHLKPDSQTQQELERAKNYVKADRHYAEGKRKRDQNRIEAAMNELLMARKIAPEHLAVNGLYNELLPVWSPMMMDKGRKYSQTGAHEKAFEAFSMLYDNNPQYPGAKKSYEQARKIYLKDKYIRLVNAYNDIQFSLVAKYSQDISRVAPDFLDTKELRTRALIKGFNAMYQKGLLHVKSNNYGMAILCFRTAENLLTQTGLTQKQIKIAQDNLRDISALKVTFARFHQQVDDPSMGVYLGDQLKAQFKSRIADRGFKNITMNFENIQENETIHTTQTRDIDWGGIQLRGYNGVIVGSLKLLKLDKAVNSDWEIRKHQQTEYVKNPEIERLVQRQALLKQELDRDSTSWARKSEIRAELKRIDQRIRNLPAVIEAAVEKEESFQVIKHTWTVYVQVDLQVESPDGGQVLPMKSYEDTYQQTGHVVPPDLHSDDPDKRKGKSLTFPSEDQFKRLAIDQLVENQIYPDLLENFENYAMRFYDRAVKLSHPADRVDSASGAFLESIEEYYKFLACSEETDKTEDLLRQVRQHLDRLVSENLLAGRPQ
jgi:tetratricopeptide (TPR) repeat protein